jgi:phenylpyruvate tautomerase PptA (4-oxalocrotonate tautomerase family)
MPICYLDAPKGMRPEAKRKMVQVITAALNKAFPIPDVRIFIREYTAAEVSQDGRLDTAGVKPSFSMSVPRLAHLDAKRELVKSINTAIAEGCDGLADAADIMVFVEEKALENVSWGGRLQSDRPEVVQALKPISQAE